MRFDARVPPPRALLVMAVVTTVAAVGMDLVAGEHPVHAGTVGLTAGSVALARLTADRRLDGMLAAVNAAVVAQPAFHASTKILPSGADHSGELSLSATHALVAAFVVVALTQFQRLCRLVTAISPVLVEILLRLFSLPRRPQRSPKLAAYEPALPVTRWSVVRPLVRRGPPPGALA